MGDIHLAVVPDWDLNSVSRRNSNHNNSAFVCVQRRSSANGMRGFVFNTDPKVSSNEEDILNCNNQLNNSWTTGCSLYDMIPSLQLKIGSNTLAIDNKIGEAMDLVKSHLMLTVRAEVAVLKEQIKELQEKNSKLEYENSILKASASPETLTKLSQP